MYNIAGKNARRTRAEMFRQSDFMHLAGADNQGGFINFPQQSDSSADFPWLEEPLYLQYHQTTPRCRVEMTDFNADLGSTGEFDNRLRLYTSCAGSYAPFLQLTGEFPLGCDDSA